MNNNIINNYYHKEMEHFNTYKDKTRYWREIEC